MIEKLNEGGTLVNIFKAARRFEKRISIKTKVILMFILIMLFLLYKVSYSTRYYLVTLQGQEDASKNLKAAHWYLYNQVERFELKVRSLSYKYNHMGLNPGTFAKLYEETRAWDKNLRPDLFFYVDTMGNVLYSPNSSYKGTESAIITSGISVLQSVKQSLAGNRVSGFEIIPKYILEKEGLLDKTSINIIPTPNSDQPGFNSEDNALTIVCAEPVYRENKIVGAVMAGQILNKNHHIVDIIDRDFGSRSAVFQGSVQVSTSVPDQQGDRAIGTVMSSPVEEKVLKLGQNYIGRAFVVNDWYIAAYEPIRDLENNVIGALYAGLKEDPLLARQKAMDNEFRLTLLAVTVLFILAFYWLYRSLIIPLDKVSSSALRMARGQLAVQIPTEEDISCWKIKNCKQTSCKFYGKKNTKCWIMPAADCCNALGDLGKKEQCSQCIVYKLNAGNEIKQLVDVFSYMAVAVHEQTSSLQKLNSRLEEKNTELMDQRDELEYQKKQLMALNAELQESMQALDDSQSIIYALAVAVEAKDPYTRGHSERVADYSIKLAAAIGIPSYKFQIIRGAALLHDIGKIGISGTILRKPSTLTAIEFQQVKKHPTIGEHICSSLKFATEILPIIRHHHEHYNGWGYPDGLKGEKIPLLARIVAIADAFDAMTSDRPYRSGMSPADALCIMERAAGEQWDPDLVHIFVSLIKQDLREMHRRP